MRHLISFSNLAPMRMRISAWNKGKLHMMGRFLEEVCVCWGGGGFSCSKATVPSSFTSLLAGGRTTPRGEVQTQKERYHLAPQPPRDVNTSAMCSTASSFAKYRPPLSTAGAQVHEHPHKHTPTHTDAAIGQDGSVNYSATRWRFHTLNGAVDVTA